MTTLLIDDGCDAWFELPRRPAPETKVFARMGGKLARWHVGTSNHHAAIDAVRRGEHFEIRGPVLALIERVAA